jgi:uncharacterized protein
MDVHSSLKAEGPHPNPLPRGEGTGLGVRLVSSFVLLYRATLGQFLGGRCRFEPSCSQYLIDAVKKHGMVRGTWRGLKRIGRCNPFCKGGYDPA